MSNVIAKRHNKDIYEQDGVCYKLFKKGYSKSAILNEALNHARAEESGLPVPKILAVNTIEDRWAIVTQYIKGYNLEQLIEMHPEKREEYLNIFVDTQIDIQSHNNALLNLHTAKMNRKISETELSATLRYDLHNRIDAMPKYHQILHGDYILSNVILSEDGKPYVVDWSHATQGNDTADAARTFLTFLLDNKEEIAREYLKLFVDKTNRKIEDILVWLPILAASQSVKKIDDEYEFLMKLVNATKEELNEQYGKI